MKVLHATILFSMASLGSIAVAQAQDTAAPPATAEPATQPPATAEPAAPTNPAAPPAAAAAAPVSDSEVQQYATALVAINQVQQDTTVAEADKQQAMVSKVQETGLAPQRFNEITQASQSDPALQQRIQTAMASPPPGSPTPQ